MLTFALYCRAGTGQQPFTDTVIDFLRRNGCGIVLHRNAFSKNSGFQSFETHLDLQQIDGVDFVVSIGGDGSFIDAANLIGDLNIPLVGINTGRIGFLSAIKKDNFETSIRMLIEKKYTLESRSLLHIEGSEPLSLDTHFVVNDVTIRATDSDSINAITTGPTG